MDSNGIPGFYRGIWRRDDYAVRLCSHFTAIGAEISKLIILTVGEQVSHLRRKALQSSALRRPHAILANVGYLRIGGRKLPVRNRPISSRKSPEGGFRRGNIGNQVGAPYVLDNACSRSLLNFLCQDLTVRGRGRLFQQYRPIIAIYDASANSTGRGLLSESIAATCRPQMQRFALFVRILITLVRASTSPFVGSARPQSTR